MSKNFWVGHLTLLGVVYTLFVLILGLTRMHYEVGITWFNVFFLPAKYVALGSIPYFVGVWVAKDV